MSKSVLAVASSESRAQSIITNLRVAGFLDPEISVVRALPGALPVAADAAETPTSPAGAGAVAGTIGALAGIALLAIPGVGPFVAAGPLMAALSMAAVGAAVGGIAGGLIGMGVPEADARAYEAKLHAGEVLLAVHAYSMERLNTAKDLLKAGGAMHIRVVGEEKVAAELHSHV